MKGKVLLAAIAASILMGDFFSYYNNTTGTEELAITLVIFGFLYLMSCMVRAIREEICNRLCDKHRPERIQYKNCEEERKLKMLKKQREEFFDNYFSRSSIEVKTFK